MSTVEIRYSGFSQYFIIKGFSHFHISKCCASSLASLLITGKWWDYSTCQVKSLVNFTKLLISTFRSLNFRESVISSDNFIPIPSAQNKYLLFSRNHFIFQMF